MTPIHLFSQGTTVKPLETSTSTTTCRSPHHFEMVPVSCSGKTSRLVSRPYSPASTTLRVEASLQVVRPPVVAICFTLAPSYNSREGNEGKLTRWPGRVRWQHRSGCGKASLRLFEESLVSFFMWFVEVLLSERSNALAVFMEGGCTCETSSVIRSE
jgi:hypothetical protein